MKILFNSSSTEDVEQATRNYVEKPYQAPVKEQKAPEPKIDWRKSLKKGIRSPFFEKYDKLDQIILRHDSFLFNI